MTAARRETIFARKHARRNAYTNQKTAFGARSAPAGEEIGMLSAAGGHERPRAARGALCTALALGLAAASGFAASAQTSAFPSRPIRVIVPFPAGGGVDEAMRIFGARLEGVTRQNVIIDNRPGAAGNVGTAIAARAAPDGHTLLATTVPLAVNPSLYARLEYDVLRDFAPVSLLASAPYVLAAHPGVPVRDVRQLLAYARGRPGELNYASAGMGTNPHVAAELFSHLTKLNIVHVPYKGAGPALAALLGGETQLSFIPLLPAMLNVRNGRLRALAVTGRERVPALPDVPTLGESGVPDYEFTSWYGVLAPRAVPHELVVALNGHLRNALAAPEIAERLARAGVRIIASTPTEFDRHLRAELDKWGRVLKPRGIRLD